MALKLLAGSAAALSLRMRAAQPAPNPEPILERGALAYNPTQHDEVLRAAHRGIREHRMRDMTLRLVDAHGRPHRGRECEVVLLRHAFPFGDSLWSLDALARNGDWESRQAAAMRRLLADVFNATNNLTYWTERPGTDASKAEERQGEYRLENFARTVEWTRAEGMIAKGHPIFWTVPKALPDWLRRYDLATQMKFAEVRVRSLVARFRGKVAIWDAVNEPMWEASLANLASRHWPHLEPIENIVAYVEPVLRWCREEDPDACFLVNDYGMELDHSRGARANDGSVVTAASQRRRYLALWRALQDRGTAPDALGLQSNSGWMSHAHQWSVYDEFAQAGVPVHVTEFVARTSELEQAGLPADEIAERHAAYAEQFLTCAFGHPNVQAFFLWGFLGSAVRWSDCGGYQLKPADHRIRRLIRESWHTREKLTTDDDGVVRFRGFYGDYAARFAAGNGLPRGQAFRVERGAAGPFTIVW